MLSVGSLFSGIGGLDLGLERAGMHVSWQCEFDPWCRRVLRKHWPDTPIYEDVRTLTDPPSVDVLVGGFPCQPFSLAGKRLAQEDPRHLWPHFARLIGDLRPRWVVGENVRGLASTGLAEVLGDLAGMGYDAEWQVVSAAAVGAPHIRERIFIVAYPHGEGLEGPGRPGLPGGVGSLAAGSGRSSGAVDPVPPANADGTGRPDAEGRSGPAWPDGRTVFVPDAHQRWAHQWAPEPDVGRVAHGIPDRMDRTRALGNAVVPQVAEFVGRLIIEKEARSGRS